MAISVLCFVYGLDSIFCSLNILTKFIVDKKWILDPVNDLYEARQYGTNNSVLWIENKKKCNLGLLELKEDSVRFNNFQSP